MCSLDENLVKKLKKLRFRRDTTNAAIISEHIIYGILWKMLCCVWLVVYTFHGWYCLCVVKIDVESMTVIEDPAIDEEDTQVWLLGKSKLCVLLFSLYRM